MREKISHVFHMLYLLYAYVILAKFEKSMLHTWPAMYVARPCVGNPYNLVVYTHWRIVGQSVYSLIYSFSFWVNSPTADLAQLAEYLGDNADLLAGCDAKDYHTIWWKLNIINKSYCYLILSCQIGCTLKKGCTYTNFYYLFINNRICLAPNYI